MSPRMMSEKKKKVGLAGMIKESQDEILELSQPFKVIFEDAINETKEEIVQRNIKTKISVAQGTANKHSKKPVEKPA